MGTLTVGRVTTEATISDPRRWDSDSNMRGRIHTISGFLKDTTLANTKALRTELLEQVGMVIPITYSTDSSLDGYYNLTGVSIDSEPFSLNNTGFFRFSLTGDRLGSEAQTEHQSLLTGALLGNDHGLIVSEVNFWHSPPVGALAYDGGQTGSPTAHTRTTEDGDIPVIIDLDTSVDPKWSVPPANYYDGGCYIKVGGYTRAGLDAANDPADWEVGNKLVKITPGTTTGVSNGRIIVSHWDGSAYDSVTYNFKFNTTAVVPEWHYMTIIKNTAETVIIRLVRDADEAPATTHRHVCDLTLRRGSLFVQGYYTYTGATVTWSVDRDSTEASTAVTPTGASTAVALRATSNDGNGNRYVMGSSKTTTKDTTNGGMDFASTNTFDFFFGAEIGGSGAATNDTAEDQCLQYMGAFTETVRAVRR